MTITPLSACLIKLIKPLLDQIGDDPGMDETRKMVSAGTAAWNTAVLEAKGDTELPPIPVVGEPSEELKVAFAELVARKKKLFPEDFRVVTGFELISQPGGEPRLHVMSMQLP